MEMILVKHPYWYANSLADLIPGDIEFNENAYRVGIYMTEGGYWDFKITGVGVTRGVKTGTLSEVANPVRCYLCNDERALFEQNGCIQCDGTGELFGYFYDNNPYGSVKKLSEHLLKKRGIKKHDIITRVSFNFKRI